MSSWGTAGSEPGELRDPAGIAVDGDGLVYVVDHGNDRIQKFTSAGEFLSGWGSSGAGEGQFRIPHGIAADASGRILVADDGSARVQVFTREGVFLEAWGSLGAGAGQFGGDSPTDVAVNGLGEVDVVDRANCRVEKFADLATTGVRATWGSVKATYR